MPVSGAIMVIYSIRNCVGEIMQDRKTKSRMSVQFLRYKKEESLWISAYAIHPDHLKSLDTDGIRKHLLVDEPV